MTAPFCNDHESSFGVLVVVVSSVREQLFSFSLHTQSTVAQTRRDDQLTLCSHRCCSSLPTLTSSSGGLVDPIAPLVTCKSAEDQVPPLRLSFLLQALSYPAHSDAVESSQTAKVPGLREGLSAISSRPVDRREEERRKVRSKSAPPTTFLRLFPSLDGSLPPDDSWASVRSLIWSMVLI